mmetsp:Transcript_8127/g.20971  ORF Transcript_8127/g.20971 Transcript_8127/m.20971 type:complete len:120 (+) Transcript_8127:66-425(+)
MGGDSIDETKVKVFSACLCTYAGCMTEGCPIGVACNETCLCLHCDCCLNPSSQMLCCGCCAFKIETPTTCIKAEQQVCCCVDACAFPCDNEVPMMLAACCVTCYPTIGVCKTVREAMSK